MKFQWMALASVVALGAAPVTAERYQYEAGASLTDNDPGDVELGIYGEYHFVPVNTDRHPLNEAAFLERSSHLEARASDDFDSLTAGGALYIPDTIFYAAADVTHYDDGQHSDTSASATFGVTPLDGLLVTTSATDDGYDPNLSAKYLTRLAGGNYVNLEASLADTDAGERISLGGDYYLDRTLSVGGAYTDNNGADTFTLRAVKFFLPRLKTHAAFNDTEWGHSLTLGAAYRF